MNVVISHECITGKLPYVLFNQLDNETKFKKTIWTFCQDRRPKRDRQGQG